jgi:hypothetical protein
MQSLPFAPNEGGYVTSLVNVLCTSHCGEEHGTRSMQGYSIGKIKKKGTADMRSFPSLLPEYNCTVQFYLKSAAAPQKEREERADLLLHFKRVDPRKRGGQATLHVAGPSSCSTRR